MSMAFKLRLLSPPTYFHRTLSIRANFNIRADISIDENVTFIKIRNETRK